MSPRTLLPLLLLALPACAGTVIPNGEGGGGSGGRGTGGAPVVTGTLTTTETATTSTTTTSWSTSSSTTTTTTTTGAGGGSTGVVISNPNGLTLDSLAAVPGGALMGARHWDTGYGVYWDVYRLGEDGTLAGPPHTIVTGTFSGPVGPMEVAAGDGHAAAIVTDEHGCEIFALDPDGSAPLGPVPTGLGWCQALAANDAGYSLLGGQNGASYDTSLVRLDAQGATLGARTLSGVGAYVARADAPTSTVFAWSTDGVECFDCPIHVVDQRFTSDGVPLGSVNPVFADPKFGIISERTHLAMVPVADGALMAWSAHGGSSSIGWLTVQRLDASGAITGPALTPLPIQVSAQAGLDLTALPSGDLLLVWVEGKDTVRGALLTPQGTAKGAPFAIGLAPWAQSIKVVPTSLGALAVVGQGGSVTAFPITLP